MANDIPDPLAIVDSSWTQITKDDNWPKIDSSKIQLFFQSHGVEKVESKKGFDYFKSNWVGQIFFHICGGDEESSTFCIFEAECAPSQRLKNAPHTAWICVGLLHNLIEKAYCSCTAG